jgi:hypothetical protein
VLADYINSESDLGFTAKILFVDNLYLAGVGSRAFARNLSSHYQNELLTEFCKDQYFPDFPRTPVALLPVL